MANNDVLSQDAFDLSRWASVTPASGWTFLSGSFSGGGSADLLGYLPGDPDDAAMGSLWVARNTGSAFDVTRWATVTPAAGWVWLTGRFASDGVDVVGYHASNGTLWVGENTGSAFELRQWATVAPVSGWTFLAGRFTGRCRDDLVGYHAPSGTLWVGVNTGAAFAFARWATVAPAEGWTFLSGRFTGGDSPDLLAYHPSRAGDLTTGSVWVGRNTGREFVFDRWASVTPAAGWTFFTGQFAGEIRADILGHHPNVADGDGTHSLWVGANSGSRFEFSRWSQFGASTWAFRPGQFAGNARFDVAGYDAVNRQVWMWANTGSGFVLEKWADLLPGQSVSGTLLAGRFTGHREDDIAGYDGVSGDLIVGQNRQPLRAYAWPQSAAPGEAIDFMVSGRGSGEVTFARHEVDAAVGETTLVDDERGRARFRPVVQPVQAQAWRHGAGWSPSLSLTIPDDWPTGIYSARFTNDAGGVVRAPFVVKPAAAQRSGLALLANVNTWLAYNNWGGNGKYPGAAYVSFLRPCPDASPGATGFSAEHQTRGELLIATWLAREGFAPDVYTDADFHNCALGGGYHTLVFGTHPEYWTAQMVDRLRAFLDAGGSVVYLGGNGVFEKASYYADGTGMIFRNGDESIGSARLTSTLFRADPLRSERALLGVATRRCGVFGGPYRVEPGRSGDPLFAGTGLADNQDFGAQSASLVTFYTAASGLEIDTTDSPASVPGACGTYIGTPAPADFPVGALPAGLRILARGQHDDGPGATMVAYDHPGGGLVFSAGSISFGSSLAVDAALQQIMRNVLNEAASRA